MSREPRTSDTSRPVKTAVQPLAGLRVVDCTAGIAGAFCSKLLADYGADVVLIEPAGGSVLRARAPWPAPPVDRDHGGLFAWLATNKASLTIGEPVSHEWLRELTLPADVLVLDREFGLPDGTAAQIAAANAHLIAVDITPFGSDGPYAAFKASRLVKAALTGWMHLVGLKGREPLVTRGDQLSECFPGAYACLAALACLLRRAATGQGELISVSEVETLLCTNRYFETILSYTGDQRERQGTASGSAYGIFETLDGQVALGVAGHLGQWERLCSVTGRPDLLELERLGAFRDNPRAHEIITAWFAQQTTQAAFEQLQLQGRLPAGPVITGEAAASVPQHVARGFFRTVDDPIVGRVDVPGPPTLLGPESWQIRTPAPALGRGGAELVAGWRTAAKCFMPETMDGPGRSPEPLESKPSGAFASAENEAVQQPHPVPLPLDGVRVVEVVDWWAGPFCGMLLADLGADVIKVESPTRLEVWRTTMANAASPKPWETGPLFNAVNRNKRHMAIDLQNRDGVEAWKAVLRDTDALVENFTPGVVEGFGFDYETLRLQNPSLCFASISGFGQAGPWRAYRANAIVAEATGLVSAVTGYSDSGRVAHGVGPGDTSAGTMTAIGIVLALLERTRTGSGQRVDSSQMETLSALMGHSIVAASLGEAPWRPAGNLDNVCAPANAYPCAGIDQWVAVSVANADEWLSLCQLVGGRDLFDDPSLMDIEERRRRAADIDQGIASWTREQDKHTVMFRLQAAGVPAGAILSPSELLGNDHYAARGFYQYVVREYVGTHPYYPPIVRLRSSPLEIRTPAPLFGSDTVEVLRDVGGLTEDDIRKLLDSGACSTEFLGRPHLDPTRR